MTPPIRSLADLAGRPVLVLGMARSGLAAARALADAGARVTAYDRRGAGELATAVAALGDREVALRLAAPPAEVAELLRAADLVVTSPSISPRFPTTDTWLRRAMADAEAAGVPIMGEVDLFLLLTSAHVLAVTGTKGKTTTTALLGAMFAAGGLPHAVGGNIGHPLIEELERLTPDHWAVLELSELQLPTIPRGAEIAVYTNIGADHLDRHASLEAYRAVKARLAELRPADGTVILNADDPGCRDLGARLPDGVAWYGLVPDPGHHLSATVVDDRIRIDDADLMDVAEVPLPGRHLRADVLAAALAATRAGLPRAAIADAIRTFPGVPHRLETVAERGGVTWVNDSQATIPVAAIAALESFGRPIVLIAGGQGKGLDYGPFCAAIAERCRAAVLIGETAGELERGLAGRVTVRRADGMAAAVRAAAELAAPGDVVLLSPAATSFDMFTDYAARGDAFRDAVHELLAPGGEA